MVIGGATGFLIVDLGFFAANTTKIPHGGWFPLVVAAVLFTVLITWRRGRAIVTRKRIEEEGPLQTFVDMLHESEDPPTRVPGTAVFLNAGGDTTPLALRYNVEHNQVLHEHVVVFTVETVGVPHVHEEDRIDIDELRHQDDGISLVTARYGFQDPPNVPAALRLAKKKGLPIDVDDASYFLSRIRIEPDDVPGGMAMWRKRLFCAMSRNASSPARYFCLPDDRVVSLGSTIEL
jgi:KUP system potassium uptake protein